MYLHEMVKALVDLVQSASKRTFELGEVCSFQAEDIPKSCLGAKCGNAVHTSERLGRKQYMIDLIDPQNQTAVTS